MKGKPPQDVGFNRDNQICLKTENVQGFVKQQITDTTKQDEVIKACSGSERAGRIPPGK